MNRNRKKIAYAISLVICALDPINIVAAGPMPGVTRTTGAVVGHEPVADPRLPEYADIGDAISVTTNFTDIDGDIEETSDQGTSYRWYRSNGPGDTKFTPVTEEITGEKGRVLSDALKIAGRAYYVEVTPRTSPDKTEPFEPRTAYRSSTMVLRYGDREGVKVYKTDGGRVREDDKEFPSHVVPGAGFSLVPTDAPADMYKWSVEAKGGAKIGDFGSDAGHFAFARVPAPEGLASFQLVAIPKDHMLSPIRYTVRPRLLWIFPKGATSRESFVETASRVYTGQLEDYCTRSGVKGAHDPKTLAANNNLADYVPNVTFYGGGSYVKYAAPKGPEHDYPDGWLVTAAKAYAAEYGVREPTRIINDVNYSAGSGPYKDFRGWSLDVWDLRFRVTDTEGRVTGFDGYVSQQYITDQREHIRRDSEDPTPVLVRNRYLADDEYGASYMLSSPGLLCAVDLH